MTAVVGAEKSVAAPATIAALTVIWEPIARVAGAEADAIARSVEVHNLYVPAAVGGPRVTVEAGRTMVDAPVARAVTAVVQVTKSVVVVYAFVRTHVAVVVVVPVNEATLVESTAVK